MGKIERMDALRAYSLGYQGLTLDRYVQVLKSNEICTVVDVRETPWSYKPGFSKKPLAQRLESEGIRYIHLKSAGNPSQNRKMGLQQHEVIERYKEHLASNPACLVEILSVIENAPRRSGVCLLCFEQHPHECHRKVILDRLAELGHILMTCHLSGLGTLSEEPVGASGVPKTDDRKRTRIHVKVAQNQGRPVVMGI